MGQQIWLSRDGKTEGPFDQAHIDKLKASGEIKNYMWIWTAEAKAWAPLHMAPPPPVPQMAQNPASSTSPVAGGHAQAKTTPPTKVHEPSARAAVRPLAAICHDNRSVVGGILGAKQGEVWIMASKDRLTEIPPFRRGAKVWINLLDEQSGQSENVEATLTDFKKTSEAWEYSLKWKAHAPRLVHREIK